jgi:solute carrier family 25 carnitine/acylcarnitine transporter 20/29
MGFYFIQIDSWRRHTNIMSTKLGSFIASGSAAMFAYWIIWPFEVLKNMAQADTKNVGNNHWQRAAYVYRTYGVLGFYRGIMPGSQSVFLRNGASMVVLQFAHKMITKAGLRD